MTVPDSPVSPEKLIILSPHFDDAILSCSSYMWAHDGAIVATVCSGTPDEGTPVSEWDRKSGFESAVEAIRERGLEDLRALELLGATPHRLGFLDAPYRTDDRIHERQEVVGSFTTVLAETIGRLLDDERPTRCLFPLGIFHIDHFTTREAARSALSVRPWCTPIVYCCLPYSLDNAEVVDQQLARLGASVELARPSMLEQSVKERAVSCYSSQLPQLDEVFGARLAASFRPEVERAYLI